MSSAKMIHGDLEHQCWHKSNQFSLCNLWEISRVNVPENPSVHFPVPLRVTGLLESLPASQLPSYWSVTDREHPGQFACPFKGSNKDQQPHTLMDSYRVSDKPMNRALGLQEETSAQRKPTHMQKTQQRTYLLQSDSANHHTTMEPCVKKIKTISRVLFQFQSFKMLTMQRLH